MPGKDKTILFLEGSALVWILTFFGIFTVTLLVVIRSTETETTKIISFFKMAAFSPLDPAFSGRHSQYPGTHFRLGDSRRGLWRWYIGACWSSCDTFLPRKPWREVVFGPFCSLDCTGIECWYILSVALFQLLERVVLVP